MAAQHQPVSGLPELAEALYAALLARGATIECQFDNLEILVPRAADPNAPPARWRLHGTVRLRASDPGLRGPG
ncbi:MAG TPA: hypothetical protein VKZ60_12100 [Chloroflexota bacterium]|jgi:hypothetical protein|nr:hypothetical protein [Chloroflexota bacterium]